MQIEYEDGDKEDLMLSNEKVKFFISGEEMERLNLSVCVRSTDGDRNYYNEMVVLAASLDDCQDLEPGDIIWAKLTGLHQISQILSLGFFYLFSLFAYISHKKPNTSQRCSEISRSCNSYELRAKILSFFFRLVFDTI
jgi:hypothetical protein